MDAQEEYDEESQLERDYYDDIMLPEEKGNNTVTKLKYLREFNHKLHEWNKDHWSNNRLSNKDA